MRTKKQFSFDEERDAEKIIENGFLNNTIDYGKIYIIAKYFRQNFNYGKIRLERELIKFCKEQDENFNPIIDSEIIKKWVTSGINYSLRKIDNISISQKEIDFLKTIEIEKDRKLLFITLVMTKALKKGSTRITKNKLKKSDNYYIRYSNFLDIIHLSKINNITEVGLTDILHKYKKHFTFYEPERELIRIEFVDKNMEKEIIIDEPERALDYYTLFFNTNGTVIECNVCGKKIVKKSNRQKLCAKCSKTIRNEKQKELMQKRRNK